MKYLWKTNLSSLIKHRSSTTPFAIVDTFVCLLSASDTTSSTTTTGTTSSTLAESPMTSVTATVSTTSVTYGKQYILSCEWLKYLLLSKNKKWKIHSNPSASRGASQIKIAFSWLPEGSSLMRRDSIYSKRVTRFSVTDEPEKNRIARPRFFTKIARWVCDLGSSQDRGASRYAILLRSADLGARRAGARARPPARAVPRPPLFSPSKHRINGIAITMKWLLALHYYTQDLSVFFSFIFRILNIFTLNNLSYLHLCTGWHIKLAKTSRWLQNKSFVLAWPALTLPGQNGTFVLKSTEGFGQRDVSPCTSSLPSPFPFVAQPPCWANLSRLAWEVAEGKKVRQPQVDPIYAGINHRRFYLVEWYS